MRKQQSDFRAWQILFPIYFSLNFDKVEPVERIEPIGYYGLQAIVDIQFQNIIFFSFRNMEFRDNGNYGLVMRNGVL